MTSSPLESGLNQGLSTFLLHLVCFNRLLAKKELQILSSDYYNIYVTLDFALLLLLQYTYRFNTEIWTVFICVTVADSTNVTSKL